MRTRSQSREQRPPPEEPPVIIEPLRIEYPFQEDPHVEPMADTRTMAQLLQAPTEGYEDAILIPEIVANNFELRHGLINLVQNKQFFGHDKEDPHAHIRFIELRSRWINLFGQNALANVLKIIESLSKVAQTRAKAVVATGKYKLFPHQRLVSSELPELKDYCPCIASLDKMNQSFCFAPRSCTCPKQ
ncbi:hypothetical protein Tco_1102061 [Tanacetum coccineum]